MTDRRNGSAGARLDGAADAGLPADSAVRVKVPATASARAATQNSHPQLIEPLLAAMRAADTKETA